MATIKWSGLVSEMKGVLNGSVFQGSKVGTIIRNNATGIGRKTIPRQDIKVNYAAVVQAWRGLSSANRATWEDQVINYPFTDKYGDPYTPSPYQLFMWANLNLTNAELSTVNTIADPEIVNSLENALYTSTSGGEKGLTFDFYPDVDRRIMVYASVPVSNWIDINKPNLRLIGSASLDGLSELSIETMYTNTYGYTPNWEDLIVGYNVMSIYNGQRDYMALTPRLRYT